MNAPILSPHNRDFYIFFQIGYLERIHGKFLKKEEQKQQKTSHFSELKME